MALPSFSLQSTSILSDPRWVLELSSISVCLGVCALVRELGKDPGYRR